MSPIREASKPTRNYRKCQQCRSDRKSCEWQSQSPQEKCLRCTRLGHGCGPPEKVPARGRPKTAVDAEGKARRWNRSPVIHDCNSPSAFREDWIWGRVVGFGRSSYALAVSTAAQRLLTRCRQDVNACLGFVVPSSTKKCQVLNKHLDFLIRDLQDRQLLGHHESWSFTKDTQKLSPDVIMSSVDEKLSDFKVLLCSANVLDHFTRHASKGRKLIPGNLDKFDVDYYESTETALGRIMKSIPWTNIHEGLSSPCPDGLFPASHIAYMNMDREAAFKLWKLCTSEARSDVDLIGRTFPHLVAEAGDWDLLGRIQASQASLFKTTRCDERGLSLLDLAVIGDSEFIVNEILKENIMSLDSTRLMERAIRRRRPQIASIFFPLRPGSCSSTVTDEINVPENLSEQHEYNDLEAQPSILMGQNWLWQDDETNYNISDFTSTGLSSTSHQLDTQSISDYSTHLFDPASYLEVQCPQVYDTPAFSSIEDCINFNDVELPSYNFLG